MEGIKNRPCKVVVVQIPKISLGESNKLQGIAYNIKSKQIAWNIKANS